MMEVMLMYHYYTQRKEIDVDVQVVQYNLHMRFDVIHISIIHLISVLPRNSYTTTAHHPPTMLKKDETHTPSTPIHLPKEL